MDTNKIETLKAIIFDKDWNVLSCGRENCKELIMLLEEAYPDVDFGNAETGFMNIENIKLYLEKDN